MNARTAALAAIYNVKINLGSLDDERFVEELGREAAELQNRVAKKENEALSNVDL
jgi:formiminotetrahydrofolate cyclodeaminase